MAAIEVSWIQEFKDNTRLALQQKVSKLDSLVRVDTGVKGEGYRPEMVVGEIGYRERGERFGPKVPQEVAQTGRWCAPRDYDIDPILEDKLDKIRNGIEMTGSYVQTATASVRRSRDNIILAAMFGSALTGKYGTGTPATFDTTNMRVVSGSTGLTVAKMAAMRAKFIYQEVDLDEEMPNIAITEKQWQDLMNDIMFISGDYNGGKPLAKGVVEEYVGFKIVQFSSKRLTYTASSERRCPCWVKSGVVLADYDLLDPKIRQAAEIRGEPYEVYAMWTLGATRLDEGKVGEILCAES